VNETLDIKKPASLEEVNAKLRIELLQTKIQAAASHLEALRQRRMSLTLEASLIDQKLLPDAQRALEALREELKALQPK